MPTNDVDDHLGKILSQTVPTDPTAKHAAAKFDISAVHDRGTLSQAFSDSLVRHGERLFAQVDCLIECA
jgi:hypothetical protein